MAVKTEDTTSRMAELLAKEEYSPKHLKRGEVVEGIVVAKNSDQILVDIGAKAEGVIAGRELASGWEEIKVGDKISSVVVSSEGEGGQALLSMKKAGGEMRWQVLTEKMNKGEAVSVRGLEANRGGLVVDFEDNRGFVPSSHLLTTPASSVGKTMEVKIIEVDKKMNRLVFSEREAHPEAAFPKIELQFKEGDKLTGPVSKILPFGLLVSLPGNVEGLVHISEISWERVGNLEELFKVGDTVNVRVTTIDPNSGKVSLSIKQLESDPWRQAEKKYPVGKVLESTINRTSSYGAFVQLEKGIEGLIHSSKIPYGTKLQAGDKVKVSIDLFNPEQRRVALRLATESTEEVKEKPKKKATKIKAVKGK
ncbi:MAG TPA: S1 RNA-binding domain-containing protein [Candidatus Nanoarchaeia archaeon]